MLPYRIGYDHDTNCIPEPSTIYTVGLLSISGLVVHGDPISACTLTATVGRGSENVFNVATLYGPPDGTWHPFTESKMVTNEINGEEADLLDTFTLKFECGDGIAGEVIVDNISLAPV